MHIEPYLKPMLGQKHYASSLVLGETPRQVNNLFLVQYS